MSDHLFAAEARSQVVQIIQLYRLVLGRPADSGGLAAFLHQVRQGKPLARVADEFLASAEFRGRQPDGGVDTAAFALELYAKAYGADAALEMGQREGAALASTPGLGAKMAHLARLSPAPLDFLSKPGAAATVSNDEAGYGLWRLWNEPTGELDRMRLRGEAAKLAHRPLISLILLIGGAEASSIERAIKAIRAQLYDKVELIIAGWPNAAGAKAIWRHGRRDRRIRWAPGRPGSGPSGHFRAAVRAARGQIIGWVDGQGQLAETAAFHVARALNRSDGVALLYGDEDLIDAQGRRTEPWFKTDWDPDAMRGDDQIGRPVFVRSDVLRAVVRGWRPDDAVWDYDLLLRITEALADDAIVHLPAVLYHRHAPATDATSADAELRRVAVEAHLARTGRDGWKAALGASGAVCVIVPPPQPAPLVSIIVPTRDRADLLETCLEGLLNRTDYPALEILIVDNDSREARTRQLFEAAVEDRRVRILPYPERFNWGRINNFAVGHARGDIVVLLNNDTDVIDPDWLTELSAQAMRPEIGVVGATLLYPDQTLQHAGLVFGPNAAADHVARHRPADDPGYRGRLAVARSASAVTGACMALRKQVYLSVGGIEEGLRVTWSDTDLCLKAWAQGLRVIVTPHARLFHIELATRGSDETPEAAARFAAERDWMRRRWGERLNSDPFFSANLTPDWAELRLNYRSEI